MSPLLTHTLSNGLQVIGQVLPDVQSLAVCYYVRVGSRAEESPMTAGIAHFLEHMAFRSTRKRSGLELNRLFQRMGMVEVNACTGTDATLYYASGLNDALEQTIALFSEMLFPLFQEEEVEMERGAILNEIAQWQEEPDALLRQHLREVYFGERYALAHDGLGTPESVQNIHPAQLRDFWATHYTAKNVTVAVVGNVREEHLLSCLEHSCGTWPAREVPPTAPFHYLPAPRTSVVVKPSLQQQFMMLAMPAVTKGHPLYLATLLGASILEERLYWSLVHKGLAESLDVDVWSENCDILRTTDLLSIETNTTPQTAPRVLGLIQRELSHLLQDGITEAELFRKKHMLISGRLLGYEEERLFRAWELAEQWDSVHRVLTIEEEQDKIEQVSQDEVMRAMYLFPLQERQVVVALGPLSQEELLISA